MFYCVFECYLDGNVLCVILLDAAKLCECHGQAVAHYGGQAPRKRIEGALKQTRFDETVHELEENLTRFRRLNANKRWNSVTASHFQIGAVECRGKQRSGHSARGVTSCVNAEGNHLAIGQDIR